MSMPFSWPRFGPCRAKVLYTHGVQIFPTLLRIDPTMHLVSPATMYFMLQCAVILGVALLQFHVPGVQPECTELFLVPDELRQVVADCAQALDALAQEASRCDLSIVTAIHTILSNLQHDLDAAATSAMSDALLTLAHYRWRGQGKGIIALSDMDAVIAWNYVTIELSGSILLPPSDRQPDIDNRRAWIAQLSSREHRICEPGYFDLSIRFL